MCSTMSLPSSLSLLFDGTNFLEASSLSTCSPQARTREQSPNSSLLAQVWPKGNGDYDVINLAAPASSELSHSGDVSKVGSHLQVTLYDFNDARCSV
uniref:Uncharacterized protein n=1 Tax=Rhipicephalus zambeziensis TaxID=60191 RepID=A0A224Y7K7_9ACAR